MPHCNRCDHDYRRARSLSGVPEKPELGIRRWWEPDEREPYALELLSVQEIAERIELVRQEDERDRRLARWLEREERRSA
jgi:uncharacterized small protein (DUF1192 family)